MERRKLGRAGFDVPAVGMGTWKTFDVHGARDRAARRAVVDAALAAGSDLFDSSPMYGAAEEVLAGALEGRRERARVATKVWTPSDADADAERQIERALAWYGGRVDVYQVHNLVQWEKRLARLERLKAEGRVLAVGATHWDPGAFPALLDVMRTERLDMVQVPLNPAAREVERDVLPLAERLGLGVIVMEPLGSGDLVHAPRGFDPERLAPYGVSSWPQAALKWTLSDPRVSCVIPATTSPAHAAENAAAGAPPWFEEAERERLARLVA